MQKSIHCVLLSIIMILSGILAGCGVNGKSDIKTSVDSPKQIAAPLKVTYEINWEALKDEDGSDLVRVKVITPIFDNPNNLAGISAINEYYRVHSEDFIKKTLATSKEPALKEKRTARELRYEFIPFEYTREFSIFYNANNLLSIINLHYQNTGGVYTQHFYKTATFDVRSGQKLSLSEIFGSTPEETKKKVYETVVSQIEVAMSKAKGHQPFFTSFRDNTNEYYSEENFAICTDEFIFYFQPGTISDIANGIPTFELSYAEAGKLAIDIPVDQSNELRRDVYYQAERLIEDNIEIFRDIYGLAMLPLIVPEPKPENAWVFPVKDKRFKTFKELEGFIRTTYVKSAADELLGMDRYFDKNGILHGDMSKDASIGYYGDWSKYSFQISDISADSAQVTIHATTNPPSGKENVEIKVKMIKENGLWLLERMFE